MGKMLHLSKIDILLERNKPMDITYTKKSTGEIIDLKQVTVTSIFGKEGTFNVLLPNNDRKTLRKLLVDRIDNIKIFM